MAETKIAVVVDSVRDALQLIADLNGGKAFHVVNYDALFDESAAVPLPAAGVVYEGTRAAPTENVKNSHRAGMSCEVGVAIALLTEGKFPQGEQVQGESHLAAIDLLDLMRRKLLDTKSPTGHSWRFVYEGPVATKKGTTVWIQRWATPIQLTPAN